jgi:hypothetical protein
VKPELESLEVIWRGESPLICHNGRLANPLNPYARKVKSFSSKRKKTDEDFADLARIEFEGSLYLDERYGPCIPCNNILATTISGARKSKMGREIDLALFVEGTPKTGDAGVVKLEYEGPRDIAQLWGNGTSAYVDSRLVVVNRARIMRTRPIFPQWSLHFIVRFDASVVNDEGVIKSMEDAGFYSGLCDYRPRYGRFTVEIL